MGKEVKMTKTLARRRCGTVAEVDGGGGGQHFFPLSVGVGGSP